METVPTYQISTKNGIVVACDLLQSAPAIQLHEGVVSKGDKLPKDLDPGESAIVAYPLVQGRMICCVTRTDGIDLSRVERETELREFVEPDSVPINGKPKVSGIGAKAVTDAIAEVKTARKGRGRKTL